MTDPIPQPVTTPPAASTPRGRWPRRFLLAAASLAFALALYALGGFFAVPALVESKLPGFADRQLHRKASIGKVKVNPFTLRVELRDFNLAEADGRPIGGFAALVADLEWSSITRRAWHFAEVRLTEPKALLDIAPDGRINLAALIDDLTRDWPKDTDAELPRLVIDALVFERGRADFTDRRAGYTNALAPISVRFDNLSTLPQDKGPYTFSANTTRGGVLRWKGEASLNPIAASGVVSAESISLPELAAYAKPYTAAEVIGGKAGFELPYRASYRDGRVEASINGAAFSVEDFALKAGGAEEPFLALKTLKAGKVNADYAKREISVDSIAFDGGKAVVKRDANGVLNVLALAKAPAATSLPEAAKSAGDAVPWKLKILQVSLDNFALGLEDRSAAVPLVASIGRVSIKTGLDAEFGPVNKVALGEMGVGIHQLSVGPKDAPLMHLDEILLAGAEADLERRHAKVASVSLRGGHLKLVRDKQGRIDLLDRIQLALGKSAAAAPSPEAAKAAPWKLNVAQIGLDSFALGLEDQTAAVPVIASIGRVEFKSVLDAEFGSASKVALSGLGVGVHQLALRSKDAALVRLDEILLSGGEADLAARSAKAASVSLSGGHVKLVRDKAGRVNLLDLVPTAGSGAPWRALVGSVSLDKFTADLEDVENTIALHAHEVGAKLKDVSNDPKRPLRFEAGFALREGGRFSAKGRAVPAQAAVDADVTVDGLALKPMQPILARFVKLRLAAGTLSAQGAVSFAPRGAKAPQLRYSGGFDVMNLRLDEESGELFAALKNMGTDKLTLTLQPNRLEVPELRLTELNAKLLIDADGTLNATRLLVSPPPAVAGTSPLPSAGGSPDQPADPFPLLVRRMRVQNATLDFADLTLRPQFGAKIHELNGVINGLSTNKATRSQLELDGRVGEFGLARIRGELNPFAPRNNTDVSVVFRNVDLVTANPYSMKFAGYRIASGKVSLDLKYRVRNSQLEGQNSVVLDQLVLGERVDSPDALKLPLELALALLKDSEGRINLELPVSGSLEDPQFSYGALVWKAITTVLTRIVTAPFRALGSLFGVSGDKLGSIDFDAGSARLQPPEREKLKQVATVLAKRPQLTLSVPGPYNEATDGLAIRTRAVRVEVALRAGIKVADGEEPGPPDLQDNAVRGALRALLVERSGAADWDKRKAEAEEGAKASGATITVMQRARRLTRGEPQVADLAPMYRGIYERVVETQALAPDALQSLARRRSDAVVDALKGSGIEAARLAQPAAERAENAPGKAVPLKLGLSSR